jgi:hypothetical protein
MWVRSYRTENLTRFGGVGHMPTWATCWSNTLPLVGLTKPRLHFKRQGTNPFSLHPNYMRSHLRSLFSKTSTRHWIRAEIEGQVRHPQEEERHHAQGHGHHSLRQRLTFPCQVSCLFTWCAAVAAFFIRPILVFCVKKYSYPNSALALRLSPSVPYRPWP